MPTDIAQLGIKIEASDIRAAVRELDRLEEKSKDVEKSTLRMERGFGGLQSAIAAIGFGVLTRQVIQQINVYSALNNKLKLVTGSTGELKSVQDSLFIIAQDTRASLEGTVDLYARLARSTEDLNISSERLAAVTKTVNQAVTLSGASAETAQAALFQLGQGLGAGALRGEELNSVLEGTPELARAIARGLGVTIAQLREMGAAGQLTAEQIIAALEAQSETVNSEFGKTAKTVEQALQQIENVALRTFGALDASELIEALDTLKDTLQDPAVISGLQAIGSGLVNLVTIATKGAAAFGEFGKALGFMFARMAGFTTAEEDLKAYQDELAKVNERMIELSAIASSGQNFKPYEAEMQQAAKRAAELQQKIEQLKSSMANIVTGSSDGGAPSSTSTGGVSPEQMRAIDSALEYELEAAIQLEEQLNAMDEERRAAWIEAEQAKADEWNNIWTGAAESFARGMGNAVADVLVDQENAADAAKALVKNVVKSIISDLVTLAIKRAFFQKAAMVEAITMSKSLALAWSGPATFAATATAGGAVVAGQAALTTALATNALAGQFHEGTDNVQRDGSYYLQKGEMVIDKGTSDKVRDNLQGGDTFIIQAIDSQSISDMARNNRETFLREVVEAARDNNVRLS